MYGDDEEDLHRLLHEDDDELPLQFPRIGQNQLLE